MALGGRPQHAVEGRAHRWRRRRRRGRRRGRREQPREAAADGARRAEGHAVGQRVAGGRIGSRRAADEAEGREVQRGQHCGGHASADPLLPGEHQGRLHGWPANLRYASGVGFGKEVDRGHSAHLCRRHQRTGLLRRQPPALDLPAQRHAPRHARACGRRQQQRGLRAEDDYADGGPDHPAARGRGLRGRRAQLAASLRGLPQRGQ
mmetsp:Transcript_6572/g.20120  ORF Transcript_6572/g.20120 Transcript_6572/m.20120 type:complete len:206 (-) Transcript_6572:62-679(-)